MPHQSKKILILAEGQLGDVLVITPALKAVKQSLPGCFLSILLFYRRRYTEQSSFDDAIIRKSDRSGTAEVFKNFGYIDEVLEMDRGALRQLKGIKRAKAELRNIKILRDHKFDTVISAFPQDRFSWYSRISGANRRIGLKSAGMSFFLTDKLDINQESNGVLEYFLRLVEPLGAEPSSKNTMFNIESADEKHAKKFFDDNGLSDAKNVIGVHPGSSQHDRKWLPSRFAEVINYFSSSKGCRIILLYSRYDIPFIDEIKKGLSVPVDEVMTSSLSELAAYMKLCTVCLTHSSGPRHLAAAVGEPTVGVFDKRDKIRWGIYDESMHPVVKTKVPCSKCPDDRCLGIMPEGEKYSSYCMRDVKTEDVIETIKRFVK